MQSIARYQALDALTLYVHSVKMSVGFGKRAETSKGRPLSVTAYLKRCVGEVNSVENYLRHALVIVIVSLTTKSIGRGKRSFPRSTS
jgi:hypothetical protein